MKRRGMIAAIVGVALLTGGVAFAEAYYRFSLSFNPITRAVAFGWDKGFMELPSGVFGSDKQSDVLTSLANAGFVEVRDAPFLEWRTLMLEPNEQLYIRAVRTIRRCGAYLLVQVRFDEQSRLILAQGAHLEDGCL